MARDTTPSAADGIVGRKAVTPDAVNRSPNSHSRSGSRIRSMPWAPLIWRSMNPGATSRPLASSTGVAPVPVDPAPESTPCDGDGDGGGSDDGDGDRDPRT